MKTLSFIVMLLVAGFCRADANADRLALAQAQAEAELRLKSQRTRLMDEAQPSYRWTTETPGQLTLWRGDVQVGGFRRFDGQYLSYTNGVWAVAECPIELPDAAKYAVKGITAEQEAADRKEFERQIKLAKWNTHPLNVGSCPCSKIGGCRCDPHSDCAAGKCAQHNPNLSVKPVVQPATQPAVQYTMPSYFPAQN